MKIAFATSDGVHINAHFGWARTLAIYEVDTEGYTFFENFDFTGDLKEDGNEDKLEPKIQALKGCTIVYVAAIGGSAAARIIHHNITPIKSETEDDKIQDVLERLVKTLNGSPPPWLRKALQKKTTPTFDEVEADEEEVLV